MISPECFVVSMIAPCHYRLFRSGRSISHTSGIQISNSLRIVFGDFDIRLAAATQRPGRSSRTGGSTTTPTDPTRASKGLHRPSSPTAPAGAKTKTESTYNEGNQAAGQVGSQRSDTESIVSRQNERPALGPHRRPVRAGRNPGHRNCERPRYDSHLPSSPVADADRRQPTSSRHRAVSRRKTGRAHCLRHGVNRT